MAYHASEVQVRPVGFGGKAGGRVVGEEVKRDCAGQGVRCRQGRGHRDGFTMAMLDVVACGWG